MACKTMNQSPLHVWRLGIFLFGLMATGPVVGDEVFLTDGTRLVGKVQELANAILAVDTDFAGVLRIDSSKIAGLSAERRLMVTLKSGEQAAGTLNYSPEQGQVLIGTVFGDLPLKLGQVAMIRTSGQLDPVVEVVQQQTAQLEAVQKQHSEEVTVLKQQHEQEVAGMRKRLKKAKPDWQVTLELGLTGHTGTRERAAFNGRAEARRTSPGERVLTYLQGRYAEQDSERSANEILGGISLEVDQTDRWFTFGKIGMEFDEFEELDLRSAVTTGLGYFYMHDEGHELKGRFGLGYQHESFMDGRTDDQGLMEVGFDYLKEISPWLLFTQSSTFYPTLDDLIDYRVVSETAGIFQVSKAEGWKLKVGMRNGYNSMSRPGVDRLDTYYFVNLIRFFD